MVDYVMFVYCMLSFVIIICALLLGVVSRENKHLKEENKRLREDLLQQANENLKLKNNFSTDSL